MRKGASTKVFWNVDNVTDCAVTTPDNSWTGKTSGPSGQTSAPIYQQTTFTLACTGLDGSSIYETATAGLTACTVVAAVCPKLNSDSSGGKHLAGIGVVKIATVCCWLWLVPQH